MKRLILSAMPLMMAAMAASAQEPTLKEGFESGDVPPSGWTVRACTDATSNKYKWESVAYGSDPLKYRSGYAQGGERCMMVSSGKTTSTKPAPDSWLITPQVAVASGDNLSFMLAYAPVYNDNAVVPEDKRIKFAVLVSTTGTDAADFTETLMEIAPYGETDWRKKVVSLEKYAGKNIYIAFREYGDYDKGAVTLNRTWIDDVVVGKTESSDLVATQLLSPVAGPKSSQTVTFSYTNSGMASKGMKASYKVNDGDIVTETLDQSVSCAAGDTLQYTFATPATLNIGAENTVRVWMEAANDDVHENDTLAAKVNIDNVFALPYEMNSDNLSVGWSYTYHNGKVNLGTNAGWWQVPDDSFTKLIWVYKLCTKESILEGKWFRLSKGKLNVAFNYASGTEAPLTLILTDSETGETTETAFTLPASTDAADTKTNVSVPADGLYKLGIKVDAEYAGPLSLNSLSLSKAVPGDVSVKAIALPTAIVAEENCPVTVTVANYGEEKAENVPLKVEVDGALAAEATVPSVEPGKSVDYTISDKGEAWALSLVNGTHYIKVYTALEDDADLSNDSIMQTVYAYNKPSMPFADSFADTGNSKRWTMENMSDNVLNWNIGSAVANGIDWSKDADHFCAYMSSVSGAEHNAVLRSPVITVDKPCSVRLSYYYTTRMYSAEAGAETYLTAKVSGVSDAVADYSAERTDTITDANVRAYRQGFIYCQLPAAGDYQLSFLDTGKGHDIVLDDVRFDQESDIAILNASQTAVSGYNNTVDKISVKVANYGAEPVGKVQIRLSNGDEVKTADFNTALNPGDTVALDVADVDISAPKTYSFKVEAVAEGDADAFNNSWQLPDVTSYANAVLPYTADFDTDEEQSQWQLGGTWQTGKYSSASAAYNGTGAISHHKAASSKDGDWAYSGCIEIPAGTYDLTFFYRTFLNGKTANLYAQNFSVCLGSEPSAEAMTQTLWTSGDDALVPGKRYKKVSQPITIAESGKYYLGIKCESTTPYGVLYVDNLSIAADETQPIQLTSYYADFSEWHAYDPSDQFSQWNVSGGHNDVIQTEQYVFNAGNPMTELPGLIVSPAMNIEKGAVVSATYNYMMHFDNEANFTDEEKAKMQANLYVGRVDNPEAFTTLVASGNVVGEMRNVANGSFVASESGTYYFAVGLAGAQNCITDQDELHFAVYELNIQAVVDGIANVQTESGAAVELYSAGGVSLGRFDSLGAAVKSCPAGGVYIVKSSAGTMKIVR